jgi:Major Facilitator Superfamily
MADATGQFGVGPSAQVHQRSRHHRGPTIPWRRVWDRQLAHYPDTVPRYVYLTIVVLAAIVLYYEYYVQAAVTPSLLVHYNMTWPFFVYVLVVGNLIGAFASLFAGMADRWGRANLVAYGLVVTALIALIGLPYAGSDWAYGVLYSILGFVEGVILVATPALIRDFSPQLGRASAMAFWTMGPVIASLIVAEVSSHTLNHLHAWQDQFTIAGIVGLVVFAIAFVGLRELSPGLRDQLMVSTRERALVEARATGVNVEESLKHPWRQMLRLNIVVPSLGIGIFLIIYYTLIAFLVVFMASIFNYTQLRANLLGNWVWAFNAVALIVVGVVSDKLRVRKPFMLVGAAVAMLATAFFAATTTNAGTGYYTFVWILSLLAVGIGLTFSPWLAAFTETAEARNPALVATGLAVWGWVLRLMVAGSFLILPYIVTTMTPIVEHGSQVQTLAAKYSSQLTTLSAIDPATQAKLTANPANPAAIATAVGEISRHANVTPAVALQQLIAVGKVPKADLAYLTSYGPQVQKAVAAAPHEWQRWWWVCFGAQALLIPTIFLMRGRWSPKAARQDDLEHERMITEELAALGR